MVSSRGRADEFADKVKLALSKERYLSERQRRRLLIEALDDGLPLDAALEILAETVAGRGGADEVTLDHDIGMTLAAIAGDKGWLSRTSFNHAMGLYRCLSGGAISQAEARSRVKELMLRHGWKVRGEVVFGTPHWFRAIPSPSTGQPRRQPNNASEEYE